MTKIQQIRKLYEEAVEKENTQTEIVTKLDEEKFGKVFCNVAKETLALISIRVETLEEVLDILENN